MWVNVFAFSVLNVGSFYERVINEIRIQMLWEIKLHRILSVRSFTACAKMCSRDIANILLHEFGYCFVIWLTTFLIATPPLQVMSRLKYLFHNFRIRISNCRKKKWARYDGATTFRSIQFQITGSGMLVPFPLRKCGGYFHPNIVSLLRTTFTHDSCV